MKNNLKVIFWIQYQNHHFKKNSLFIQKYIILDFLHQLWFLSTTSVTINAKPVQKYFNCDMFKRKIVTKCFQWGDFFMFDQKLRKQNLWNFSFRAKTSQNYKTLRDTKCN